MIYLLFTDVTNTDRGPESKGQLYLKYLLMIIYTTLEFQWIALGTTGILVVIIIFVIYKCRKKIKESKNKGCTYFNLNYKH